MKRYLILILLLSAPFLVNSQDYIDTVFRKYTGTPGYTSIIIEPQIFKLLSLLDKDDEDLMKLSSKFTSIRILVSDDRPVGFTNEVRAQINKNDYLSMMQLVDGATELNFYARKEGSSITHFLLLSTGTKEEVLISVTGKFNESDLSSIANSSYIDGSNKLTLLKKLEDK